MRRLDLYILREIAVPFIVGMGLFFVVVVFAQLLEVSDSVTGLAISGADILVALIYSLPPVMGLLIPVSLLFATLLGIGRLATDREIIAMTAAGVTPYRLLLIPGILGLTLALGCGYIMAVGEPWGIRGLRDLMQRSAQRALASGVRVGEFNEWVPGVTFLAKKQVGRDLQDVVFADRRNPRRPVLISARHGQIGTGTNPEDIVFELRDGAVVLHDDHSDVMRVLRFDTSLYRLDVENLVGNKMHTTSASQEKSIHELWVSSHDTTLSAKRHATYTITLQRKFALPTATLLFALLAVTLAAKAKSGARARGFLYSAGIVGAYYYLGRAVELTARNGNLDPVLAAWTPNLIGLCALAVLLIRLRRTAA